MHLKSSVQNLSTYIKRSNSDMSPFEQLKYEIQTCRVCAAQFSHEPKPIFQGMPSAKIMQISQAPSKKVMESGLPFHDMSGKKLKQEWYEISDEVFYQPEMFYISSIARCFPGRNQRNHDLPPVKACAQRFLNRELELVHPQLYLIIGSYAARYLFGREQTLEELIFHDQELMGKKAYVLPHPSPLNQKWLRDHPEFEQQRMPEIRSVLHKCLFLLPGSNI